MDKGSVKNRIGETLLKRILRAHREGSVFRVFVVMPLLPGFEGEVGGPSGTALRAITHWNYASISRYDQIVWVLIIYWVSRKVRSTYSTILLMLLFHLLVG